MSMFMKFRMFANEQTDPSSFSAAAIDLEKCCCGGVKNKKEMDQCGTCGAFMCMGTECDCPCAVDEEDSDDLKN
jgi:hypothetical protein